MDASPLAADVAPEFSFNLPQDPSLSNIPIQYVIHHLHQLGPKRWNHPETASCAVMIPNSATAPVPPPGRRQLAMLTPNAGGSIYDHQRRGSYSGLANVNEATRRVSAPLVGRQQNRILLLHAEIILPQSMLFRALFTASPHLDILTSTFSGNQAYDPPWSPFRWPSRRSPHIIANGRGLPTALIPLPHPSSFPSLLHWLYFGDNSKLAAFILEGPSISNDSPTSSSPSNSSSRSPSSSSNLRSSSQSSPPIPRPKSKEGVEDRWMGLVLNAEYLGLDVRLRTWLSDFWTENMDRPMPEFYEECEDPEEEERRRRARAADRASNAATDQDLARRMAYSES